MGRARLRALWPVWAVGVRISLSTFVMISQNRADAKRQVIADQQWKTVQEEEDQQNKELLDLSRQILELTKEVRSATANSAPRLRRS
jgi:uncharacterized membrane protein